MCDLIKASSTVRGVQAAFRSRPFNRAAGRGKLECRASRLSSGWGEEIVQDAKILVATGALTATLAMLPFTAQAVSGGGGLGTSLSGKDFSGQNLAGQKFYKADMRQSNFSKANLKGANLYGAFAKDANFSGADLTGASIESVDFEGADLSNAVLTESQGTNARFKDTNVQNTDWSDAILRRDVQKTLCKLASGRNPTTGVDTRESLMC